MKKSDSLTYVAPRAVRMNDAPTAQFRCVNGPSGNAAICSTGSAVEQHVCSSGAYVQH